MYFFWQVIFESHPIVYDQTQGSGAVFFFTLRITLFSCQFSTNYLLVPDIIGIHPVYTYVVCQSLSSHPKSSSKIETFLQAMGGAGGGEGTNHLFVRGGHEEETRPPM
jgi:hypothetical protein